MPRSITIHDVDDATANWLVEETERRGICVERVAGLLLRGLEWERSQTELPTYHDLDTIAGTWNEDEATAFADDLRLRAGGSRVVAIRDMLLDTNAYVAFKQGTADAVDGLQHAPGIQINSISNNSPPPWMVTMIRSYVRT